MMGHQKSHPWVSPKKGGAGSFLLFDLLYRFVILRIGVAILEWAGWKGGLPWLLSPFHPILGALYFGSSRAFHAELVWVRIPQIAAR